MYYDSSTISGDACTILQDDSTTALRLPTFCLRCHYDLTASRSCRQLKVSLQRVRNSAEINMPPIKKKGKKTAKSNSPKRESEQLAGGIDKESTHANLQQQVQESLETDQLQLKKRKKATINLTEAEEEDVVEWVMNHLSLYDRSPKIYKDTNKKQKLCEDKAKELDMEGMYAFLGSTLC